MLELDMMQKFRAAHTGLCHEVAVHALHWECWVAAMRNVIGLFSVTTEYTERATHLTMPGASLAQWTDALAVLRLMRASTAKMQRRLEYLVMELRSGVEARQRAALVLLLRWCGQEPREADYERYVWGVETGAAAASERRPRDTADGCGRADAAELTGHAENAVRRAAEYSDSPVAQRATRRACAAAGLLCVMGAGTKALASAPLARSTVSSPPPLPPLPEPAAGGRAAPKLVSKAQATDELRLLKLWSCLRRSRLRQSRRMCVSVRPMYRRAGVLM